MPSPRPRNVYESRNRAKKVTAMGEWVWERLTPQERRDPGLVGWFRQAPQSFRDRIARSVDKKPPSEETWEALCGWLDVHVRWAQQDAA